LCMRFKVELNIYKPIMKLIFALLFSMCLFLNCTDNLRPKEKSQPTIYPPVHYSLSDTLPQKLDSVTGEPKEDGSHPSQIVHKALCRYTKLSEKFDFALAVDVEVDGSGYDIFLKTYVQIISKANGSLLQTIQFEIGTNTGDYDCIARSYSTGHNMEAESVDGFFGDIVVADLNFDGKEDIAVARGFGYTMFYNFYLQNDKSNLFSINI